MMSHNSIFYGRPQEGFNMVRADTEMDMIPLRTWLFVDDVVQKTHFGNRLSSERPCKPFKQWKAKGADL